MALSVTHSTVVATADDGTSDVGSDEWNAAHSLSGVLGAANGGTGIANNAASTITISGAFDLTLTLTASTGLTLPTSGTVATTSNKLSAFAATTSLELLGVISDETGTGALVFANTPTLVTPALGAATATSVTASGLLQAGSSATIGLSTDVLLYRDAAAVLALRNSTTAQTFRVYNTESSSLTNYERLDIGWAANVISLESTAGGTGTVRNLRFKSGGGNLEISNFLVQCNADFDMQNNPMYNIQYANFGAHTVAQLPAAAAGNARQRRFVTDSNSTTFAAVVAAGGANVVPVFSDGTNWRIG